MQGPAAIPQLALLLSINKGPSVGDNRPTTLHFTCQFHSVLYFPLHLTLHYVGSLHFDHMKE